MAPALAPASATCTGYRAVNSPLPPIALFDDVADADQFDALYALQARTNPRMLNEVGHIELIAREQIPFGIPGCSYATGPFTHVNPAGSRFSGGSYGVLYIADTITTALAEVGHHQQLYWSGVVGLKFDRIVLRGLQCTFATDLVVDAGSIADGAAMSAQDDYTASRAAGRISRAAGDTGVRYESVRRPGNTCWGLFTPSVVKKIVHTSHYEMVWDGARISAPYQLTAL